MLNLKSRFPNVNSSLGRSAVWNLLGAGIPLVVGLLVIPQLISSLGVEAFGLLTLIWAAIGYFSLFDFGLGRALTQQLAARRAMPGAPEKSIFYTGALSTLLPGLLGMVLLWALAAPLVNQWLNISVALQAEAYRAMLVAAFSIPLVTLSSGLRGMLEGFEDFKSSALLRMLLGLLNFLLPWLLVMGEQTDLEVLVWSLLASRLLAVLLNVWMLQKHAMEKANKRFDPKLLRHLLGFGSWMTLSNLIGPLMVTADRYFIAAILSANVVAFYTVPQDLVLRLLLVPNALVAALFPRMSLLNSEGAGADLQHLFRKSYKILALSMAALLLPLALVSYPALSFWLGSDFADQAWALSLILMVGIFFNSLAMLPFTALQARGAVKSTSLLHLTELLLYYPLMLFLLKQYGLIGAAWAWSARTAFDWLALQWLHSKQ